MTAFLEILKPRYISGNVHTSASTHPRVVIRHLARVIYCNGRCVRLHQRERGGIVPAIEQR